MSKTRDMILRIAHYFAGERERLRLKQKEVAEAVGITVPTLSRYENGKAVIPDAIARQLAAIYRVEPDGWKRDDERALGDRLRTPTPSRYTDRERVFDREDPRYWSARWDQAVSSLRRVLAEHEELAEEMRDEVYSRYTAPDPALRTGPGSAPKPSVTPEALEQSLSAQIRPDDLKADDQERAAK